jgi:hypothetical protein
VGLAFNEKLSTPFAKNYTPIGLEAHGSACNKQGSAVSSDSWRFSNTFSASA